jgi:hypothetical protein
MPKQSTFYEVTGTGKTSSRLFEGVRYGLTASASASSVAAGSPVTLSGTVTPGHEGHPVYLQVQNLSGIGFHTVGVGQVTGAATYSISHAFYAPGLRKLAREGPGRPRKPGRGQPAVRRGSDAGSRGRAHARGAGQLDAPSGRALPKERDAAGRAPVAGRPAFSAPGKDLSRKDYVAQHRTPDRGRQAIRSGGL